MFEVRMIPQIAGQPAAVEVRVMGAVTDAGRLCAALRARLERSQVDLVVCDVTALPGGRADACIVDAIARLQLTARRLGRHLRLRGAPPRLEELLRLTGLSGVVPCCADTYASRWGGRPKSGK